MLVSGVRWSRLSTIEQVGVIAAFAQLHQNVLESHLLQLSGAVNNINIPHQNLGVHFALHLAQTDKDFDFLFRFQLLFHFCLQTT